MSIFSEENRRDPYPMYEEARSGSPVLHYAPTDAYLLFDYDSVKRALSDHETFSSAVPGAGTSSAHWLIFLDPPRHSKLRALVNRAFTGRAIASLEPRIDAICRDLVHGGEMDLVEDLAAPLPLMVIAELLGLPIEDHRTFRRWSDVILGLSTTVSGGEEALRAQQRYSVVTQEMRDYLAAHATRGDDLLTRLRDAEVDGERLGNDEILGFVQLLLIAGHETTTNLISNAVLAFLEHGRPSNDRLPAAIEEVLRHRSPVQATFRKTRRPIELHGRTIPEGKLVVASIGSANRDPAHFRDASRFDVTRDPNPHIAFGHGIHFCIGAPLSRLEARIALGHLLAFDRWERTDDWPWEPRAAFHVLGPQRLPMRFAR